MNGNWYIRMAPNGQGGDPHVIVLSASIPSLEAIDQAKAMLPGHVYETLTWRALPEQYPLPSDSQPDYLGPKAVAA